MKAPRLALVVIALALIVFVWRSGIPPQQPVATVSNDAAPAVPAASASAGETAEAPLSPDAPAQKPAEKLNLGLPPSLAGTEIDGAVELDANGQLKLTHSLRRLFDQVLTLVGERSIDEIRALLAQRLDTLTTAEAKPQVLAAFERYLRYLQAASDAAPALQGLDLEGRLAALKELRRQQLGNEMADGFFAEEEAYQEFTLAGRALAETPNLTAEERASRERELIQALPESARAPLLEQRATEAALADADRIEASTTDAAERERLRQERFGAEAAARMQALDRERALWSQRVAAYQAERARIRAMRMNSQAQQTRIDEYLESEFDDAEQRRIRSLEAIGEL